MKTLKPLLFVLLFSLFFSPALQGAEYLGGNVWHDLNVNGIQDAGEVGAAGITVTITGVSTTYSGSTTTASDGSWTSADLRQNQTYSTTFSGLPAGYLFSPQDQGTNDNLDSDPNPSTGVTIAYSISRNQTITHVDAGIYLPQEIDIQGNGNSILKGDISPSTIDGTDLGSTYITGGTVSHAFTIANTGDANLLLSGSPVVAISGSHASNFTVTTQPTSPVSGRSSKTFVIRFAPSAVGLRSATVTIANNDSNENPYTFAIQGTGTPPPEMDVSGNGISIFSGDSSPSVTDHTYLGSADIVTGSVDYTFTISNTGGFNLNLSGSPVVQLSGTHAADFLVITQASASIVPAGTSTFVLRFDPSATGLRTATVSIANNDLDENPYTFSVQGTGSATPEIDITGKGLSIVDGSTTASLSNDSDFGNTDVNYGSTIHTFSINNSGSGVLTLTGSPLMVTVFGTHASDFTVSQQPASSTVAAQGGSVSFQVTFNPPTTGLRQATISITNNDANESPYTFAVQGTGTINPEINILGNGTSIANGASTLTSTDSTDLGSALIGGTPHIVTYTIQNTGPAPLLLTGSWPLVSISGAHAGDFSVISAPSSSVASGGSTTFKIKFFPITSGIRSATLTILNNDLDEGAYSFAIQGTGISGSATLCEIDVQGNLTRIDSLNNIPNTTDGTDLGSVSFVSGTLIQTFLINNTGSEDLILTRSPLVTISGAHAADFSIILQPSSPVAPDASVPFTVSFNPSAPGLRTALISIENNDDNENPYAFSVQGFGLSYPEIEVRGNNNIIYSGDATPDLSDSTDFGDVHPVLVTAYATYTIYNTGDSTLVLTDNPRVRIDGDAAGEYTVTSFPNASIPPGGSSAFTVKFDPAQTGIRNAMVSIVNNDSNESPYSFWVTGYGKTDLTPFPCISRFYHIYGDEGIVSYMDATVNPYAYTEITRANYSINGAGYNLEDGLLYAFEQDWDVPGDKIIRIDGDFNLDVLSVNVPFLSWRADFDVSGNMYFWDEAGTSIGIFDASEGTVTTQSTGGATWIPIDMAYLDMDGNFYGMHEATLYQYNPNSNNVSTIPITGRLADDYITNVNSAYYGAAWSSDEGYLFTTNSQSGRMYKISPAGFSIYVGLGATNLNKSDGASCPLVPAPLPTTGQVGNRVWVDNDADGVQDAGEPGLPGVTVDLYSIDSPFIASTISDENGEYVFQNLSPSEYYIIFSSAPAGFSLTLKDQGGDDVNDSDADPSTGQTANFFVGVGLIEEGIDAGYKATGVGDFIWDDLNNNGDQDYGEPGIPGLTVELVLSSNGSTVNTTISNAFGRYSFTNVTPASYRIRVSNKPGGYNFVSRNSGATDAVDSDVDASGLSDLFTVSANNFNSTVDAGLTQQSVPDISVFGSTNFNAIPDGQTVPLTSNGTDLGNQVISIERAVPIRIANAAGGADLTLNGAPILAFSGPHAADFSYSGSVPANIAPGSSVDFYLTFTPSANGLRSAVVSISNNDPDENPYDFSIQGTGVGPEIVVRGNGLEIVSGDITASVADATDFGSHDIDTGSSNAVFTIQNTGGYDLTLTGTPLVAIGGAHAGDFSITSNPTSPVSASGSTTFTVHFDPSAAGLRTANISIVNSDPDEDPYTFNIQGTGTATQEIALQGNLNNIANGDTSPSLSDLTDFGSRDIFAAQLSHSFTIQNVGSGVLTLTGLPRVQISGVNAGDFVVSQQPSSSTVSPSGSLTFQVAFDPTTTGVRQATVIIANNDSDENPFTFAIKGLGTSTLDEEIELLGNGLVIESGDNFTMSEDFTDMGTAEISGIPATATFVIRNIGYAVLSLTGPPPYVAFSGANASDFNITSTPSNSIAIDSATTSFEVTFTPSALGTRQAIVSIQNDDSDENPYTFTIEGTGIYDPNSLSEISVKGNMLPIPAGDPSPSLADGTDFGSVEVIGGFTATQEFVVYNTGSDDLVLGDNPIISITGAEAGDFTIISFPANLVAPSSSVVFTVEFNPSATGLREATISIDNSAMGTGNPFTFDIQGTGTTTPEMSVSGNGVTITSGDASPGLSDSTLFGDVDITSGSQLVTYTISNSGNASLTVGLISFSGAHASDFSVTSLPSSSVSMGGSTSFVVRFDPSSIGPRNATISIANNDPDVSPYSFVIQGNGTSPEDGVIGDRVWLDNNGNGIQDAGEDALSGITVSLFDSGDNLLGSVVSGADGTYAFEGLASGNYYLSFTNPPAGFVLSPLNQGGDDALDSDADPANGGKTASFLLNISATDNTRDAG
ncbi:MAG: choice-of-anchor D domain-containing protein, partial [Candidatus Marinimicrobia bacterium]|nr:choice-of-anchor D domain-containing protein [Candidatus Neomarinimicrobiota bacterium]